MCNKIDINQSVKYLSQNGPLAKINPDFEESIVESVTREYLEAFPHLEGKYSVHICESADGVRFEV